MYVPGKLKHNKKVMVNIGTGYYVEKVGACTIKKCMWYGMIV